MLVSGLCLGHCLLLPLAVIVLPGYALFGSLHHVAHPVLAALLLPVTFIALRHPSRCDVVDARGISGWLLGSGLVLVILAWPAHALLGPMAETASTIAGSILLVSGHVKRLFPATRRFSKKHTD